MFDEMDVMIRYGWVNSLFKFCMFIIVFKYFIILEGLNKLLTMVCLLAWNCGYDLKTVGTKRRSLGHKCMNASLWVQFGIINAWI